jgi:hypothetical protein
MASAFDCATKNALCDKNVSQATEREERLAPSDLKLRHDLALCLDVSARVRELPFQLPRREGASRRVKADRPRARR